MSNVAIVTGGTRGIGEAISMMLKDSGFTVAANFAGNQERADAFTARTGIASYRWDVSDFGACQAGVAKVEADLGAVSVLVNNAGITRDGTMHKMNHDMWQAVIDTNLGSCFNMSRAVIEGMRARKYGRIVNIGSINGQAGQYGQVNYAAAKSGIHGFTKALAQEGAGHGITVNAIAPGYIDTDMVAAVPANVLEKIVARSPSAVWVKPRKSRAACCSWSKTRPVSSPGRRCRSMGANTCINGPASTRGVGPSARTTEGGQPMLSDSEIAQYHDRGYVFPDFKLPAYTLAEIRAAHDRLLARYPEFRDNCSDLLGFDTGFLNYARNPEILDMVAQLIGPDIALWNMSFFAKPAVNGKKTPWHQDGAYWPIRPLATCTVWIAVDDATPENGCMRFIPGSHKSKTLAEHAVNNDPDYTLNQELDPATYDPAEAIDVTPKRQISLHDVYLFHGSEVNRSPTRAAA